MEKMQLVLLFKIIGLGSASGLIYHDNSIFAIGDNTTYLFQYTLEKQKLEKFPLTQNPSDNIPKPIKKDFEAITKFQDTLYVFGSGSTENRNTLVKFDIESKKEISNHDLTFLYESMQSFASISKEDFNIEGVAFDGNLWYFVNRGNGNKGKNVIFTIEGNNLEFDYKIISNEIKLPKIKGVRTSFTDCVLKNNKLYFLAAAEDTNSTYLDGEVVGCIIGCIDVNTMKIDFTKKISDKNKFEGLTLYKENDDSLEFLLCEDNDTELLESSIYKLVVKK
jgi:hypothetical protein